MPALALLVGLAAEIYFLVNDLPLLRRPAATSSGVPPIAELIAKRNSVKVQMEGEVVWDEPESGQTLYRRQSLLTQENSTAEVAFLDGTGILVDEKSLVLLEKTPSDDSLGYQRIVVRLLHGTLHKNSPRKSSDLPRRVGEQTPEIEIISGDSHILLNPSSELTIAALPEERQARVLVQSGEVRIDSPSGSVKVRQGELAILPEKGSKTGPVTSSAPFNLLSPRDGSTLEALSSSQPVRFRWNVKRDWVAGSMQEVEISQDARFETGVLRSRIAATEPPLEHVEVNVEISPGNWHWRVKTISASGESHWSGSARFLLETRATPTLKLPRDHAQISADKPVDFAWIPLMAASGYELVLQGSSPLQTVEPYGRIESLPPGKRSWRVRARLKNGGVSPWSAERELLVRAPGDAETAASVQPSASPLISSPSPDPAAVLAPPPPDSLEEPEITPAPRHSLFQLRRILDFLIPSAEAAEAETAAPETWTVRLKWKHVEGVGRYHIQIARDRGFTHLITESDSITPEWSWHYSRGMENSKGRAFYRVASVAANGTAGAYSKPKIIQLPSAPLAEVPKGAPTVAPSKPLPPENPLPVSVDEPAPSHWSVAVDTGLGNLTQKSSDASLSSVTPQSAYLQQKIRLTTQIRCWLIEAQAAFSSFHPPDDPRKPLQTDFKTYAFDLDVLRSTAFEASSSGWRLSYGATMDRSYRWVKNGPQSVESQGALSFGPSARLVRNYRLDGEGGLALDLPLTGVFTGGQTGLKGRIWIEWNLATLKFSGRDAMSLGLQALAESAYLRWPLPIGTSTFAWSFWVAPILHF